MNAFARYLKSIVHLPEKRIPHYIRWVERVYSEVGADLGQKLSFDILEREFRNLQVQVEDRQFRQAEKALALY